MPWFKRKAQTPSRVSSDKSPKGVYSDLRRHALSIKRDDIGVPAPSADAPAWGILMETGYGPMTATLVALVDGTTSLYLSNGGGVIGGQNHETVRTANTAFINRANHSLEYLKPTALFPIPEPAHTVFYVLTDSGILTGGALETDLGYDRHPLSPLFHAGHEVITQLRPFLEDDA
jgi:hypothetical protein